MFNIYLSKEYCSYIKDILYNIVNNLTEEECFETYGFIGRKGKNSQLFKDQFRFEVSDGSPRYKPDNALFLYIINNVIFEYIEMVNFQETIKICKDSKAKVGIAFGFDLDKDRSFKSDVTTEFFKKEFKKYLVARKLIQ